jgi:hypothetical protein
MKLFILVGTQCVFLKVAASAGILMSVKETLVESAVIINGLHPVTVN